MTRQDGVKEDIGWKDDTQGGLNTCISMTSCSCPIKW